MAPEIGKTKTSKFTRGEKCILVHVSLSLFMILVLLVIYVVHLCLVKHSGDQYFSITRRSTRTSIPKAWWPVGAVILSGDGGGSRKLCGCVLLRRRWSLAPAHCVAARADPTLASLLPSWALRYHHPEPIETPIDRGVVHSQFNKDDNQNNVGLFEHKDQVTLSDFTPITVHNHMLYTDNLSIMTLHFWDDTAGKPMQVAVSPITSQFCRQQVLPVMELRSYEFCTTLSPSTGLSLDHGAALILNSEVKGFFSWGDKHGHFPLVMLDISHFKDWIESLVYE